MLTISGRNRADAATFTCNSKYALSWPRVVFDDTAGSSSSSCSSTGRTANHAMAVSRHGQRVASVFVGNSLSAVIDASISPDGSLVACIGTDRGGKPCVVAGEEGIAAHVKTSHGLARVLALDNRHLVVCDTNDVAHLFVLAAKAKCNSSSEAEDKNNRATRELRAVHALSLEAIVDWSCVHMHINHKEGSAIPFIVAIVRNSHVMVLRLSTTTDEASLPSPMLKRCASKTIIPTPQRLALVVDSHSCSTSSDASLIVWLASGRECCAARLSVSTATTNNNAAVAATSSSSSSSAEFMSLTCSFDLVEGSRAAIPNGSTTREVLSVTAVSPSLAYVLLRPAEKEGAAHHQGGHSSESSSPLPEGGMPDGDDAGSHSSSAASLVNFALADAVTVALPSADASASSRPCASTNMPTKGGLQPTVPIVSYKSLRVASGHGLIAGGFFNDRFVGLVAVPRQRSIALVPLVSSAITSPDSCFPQPHLLMAVSAGQGATGSNASALFQRRMERAKAELSALSYSNPTTEEESKRHIAAILRLQDEGRALQRSVEGIVTSNSAPKALLEQLYVLFSRATLRHLFLRTNTSLSLSMDLEGPQKVFLERLSCLRSIVMETFCGLPGSLDAVLERQRWGPTLPIFTLLMKQIGVEGQTDHHSNEDNAEATIASSSSTPQKSALVVSDVGNAILSRCGDQLSADVAVAALYVVIAQKQTPLPDIAAIAATLLRSAGLSPSLLHWALLMYFADHEADAQDLSVAHAHLLAPDTSYDFGVSVMPRIVDALVCAGNIETVYLMAPLLLGKAQFALDDRMAIRVLLVAMIKGNAGLITALLAFSRNRRAPWRAVALHVTAVACAAMGQSHLLEGAVLADASGSGNVRSHVSVFPTVAAALSGATSDGKAEEEGIVEAALRAVGTRVAHRIFIEFLVMQKRYAEALRMCEVFPAGSDVEHQAVTSLAATIRCLVPDDASVSSRRPYAFTGFCNIDTPQVLANAAQTRAVDSLRVNLDDIDAIAALVSANAGGAAVGGGLTLRR